MEWDYDDIENIDKLNEMIDWCIQQSAKFELTSGDGGYDVNGTYCVIAVDSLKIDDEATVVKFNNHFFCHNWPDSLMRDYHKHVDKYNFLDPQFLKDCKTKYFTVQVTRDVWYSAETSKFIRDNIRGESLHVMEEPDLENLFYVFENKEDAIAFKLRFGGKQ